MNPNEVTITLSIETVNACLTALSKFPYAEAAPHIDAMRSAVNSALMASAVGQQPEAEEGQA